MCVSYSLLQHDNILILMFYSLNATQYIDAHSSWMITPVMLSNRKEIALLTDIHQ